MTRRFILINFFCLLFFSGHSQQSWFHYNWDASSPADFGGLDTILYRFDMKKYSDDMYVGKFSRDFSGMYCKDILNDIREGNFYKTIGGYDEYLRKVLLTVIKDTAITNRIRIMIYRDISMNASMNESGVLRLNAGYLAMANNEAELAMLMSHEVAHFVNDDVAKGFSRAMEDAGNPWLAITSDWFTLWFSNPLWNSRDQESAADFAAIKCMKGSPYSLKSGSMIYKQFKRLEIRNEILYGKNMVKIFTTHPDPGDRLKQVRFLSTDSLNNGRKNFAVDSTAFRKLKELCYEECVNEGFETGEIGALTTLSFTRYLLEPDNQYNLAVLIEVIRRSLIPAGKDKIDDKPFILSRYKTPFVRNSDNYAFLNDDRSSILNYLSKGFLDIGKDDLPLIKAKDLLDSSVVEFTTNREAYDYFRKKANESACGICRQYEFYGKTADFTSAGEYAAKNDLFATNDYLSMKGVLPVFANSLFVVLPAELSKGNSLLNRKTILEQEIFNKEVIQSFATNTGRGAVSFRSLPFKDQHLLSALLNISMRENLPLENNGRKGSDFNWVEGNPELFSLFIRNKVDRIYVCAPSLHQSMDGKDYQRCFYFCMRLPVNGKPAFSSSLITKEEKSGDDYSNFLKRMDEGFIDFYQATN